MLSPLISGEIIYCSLISSEIRSRSFSQGTFLAICLLLEPDGVDNSYGNKLNGETTSPLEEKRSILTTATKDAAGTEIEK